MTEYNDKQRKIFAEFWQKRAQIQEEMIWVGCNPSDPEMYKQQAKEGFALMSKMNELRKEYWKKIEEAA